MVVKTDFINGIATTAVPGPSHRMLMPISAVQRLTNWVGGMVSPLHVLSTHLRTGQMILIVHIIQVYCKTCLQRPPEQRPPRYGDQCCMYRTLSVQIKKQGGGGK